MSAVQLLPPPPPTTSHGQRPLFLQPFFFGGGGGGGRGRPQMKQAEHKTFRSDRFWLYYLRFASVRICKYSRTSIKLYFFKLKKQNKKLSEPHIITANVSTVTTMRFPHSQGPIYQNDKVTKNLAFLLDFRTYPCEE